MYTLKSKWGVELEAEPRDMDNIVQKINGSVALKSDLFISRANSIYILRTNRWNTAKSIVDVVALAKSIIDLIRGTIDLLECCGPIEIGTVFEFDADGNIVTQHRETPFRIRIYPADANMVSAADFRRCLDVSMANDKLRMSFSAFSSDPDWFNVYKCIEALKRHYGDENKMLNAFPSLRSKISLIKRTANSYRHTEGAFAPVANPMSLEDAGKVLRKVLIEALRSTAYKAPLSVIPLGVPNLATSDGEGIGLNRLTIGPPE